MSQGLLQSGIPEKVVRDMISLGAGHMELWNRILHAANTVHQQILHIWSSPGTSGAKTVAAFSLK